MIAAGLLHNTISTDTLLSPLLFFLLIHWKRSGKWQGILDRQANRAAQLKNNQQLQEVFNYLESWRPLEGRRCQCKLMHLPNILIIIYSDTVFVTVSSSPSSFLFPIAHLSACVYLSDSATVTLHPSLCPSPFPSPSSSPSPSSFFNSRIYTELLLQPLKSN